MQSRLPVTAGRTARNSLRLALPLAALSFAALCAVAVGGCVSPGVVTSWGDVPSDVNQALQQLPRVDTVEVGPQGIPYFVSGDLGQGNRADTLAEADAAMQPTLAMVAPVFRLHTSELRAIAVQSDELGMTHVRYQQTLNGLDVVGGQLILHVSASGAVVSATASARGETMSATAEITGENGRQKALSATPGGASADAARLVYVILSDDQSMHLAWESRVRGAEADGTPIDDLVYVDARTGATVDRHPQIFAAKNRKVYSANNGTSLPGTLKRSEGGAAVSDVVVNEAYDNTGLTYDCYKTLFNRDSYNNGGATLTSSVHYSSNYVNAYWDGTQMVYGDGDGVNASPLAGALDVTAHELTHAVTQSTSNLNYSNESGALNEAWSDIMAAVCESWRDGGANANTWKVGEEIWTPGTAGDALRYMNNPTADGQSYDYYPQRYTGSQDNGGVHLNSGIANLAFYLVSQGGTHPRSKTTIVVTGLGIDKAAQIFYRAETNYLTPTSNFAAARTATAQAATDLYGADAACSVNQAWAAVGVGSAPSCTGGGGGGGGGGTPDAGTGGGGGGGGVTTLTSGVPVSGLSGATGAQSFFKIDVPAASGTTLTIQISGGLGDADLYVKKGTQPTTSSYDYRPYLNGNAETVTLDASAGGTWYIMLNGYAAYSGVTLVATASAGGGGGGGNVLQKGVPVTLSGARLSTVTYSFAVPSGTSSLTVKISGGSGDADLYVKRGSAPTTTSYDYRPYLNGNNETVTVSAPASGTWYVMVRGYAAYSGVSLVATW